MKNIFLLTVISLSFQQNSIKLNANNTYQPAKNDSKTDRYKAFEKLNHIEESLKKIFLSPQEVTRYDAKKLQEQRKLNIVKNRFKELTLEFTQSSFNKLKDFKLFCEQYENENFYGPVIETIALLQHLISEGISLGNSRKLDKKKLENIKAKKENLQKDFSKIGVLPLFSENAKNDVRNFLHNKEKVMEHEDQLYEAFQGILSYIRSCTKNNKDPVFINHMPFIKNFIFSITNLEALKNFAMIKNNDKTTEINKRNFVSFILRDKGERVSYDIDLIPEVHLTPEEIQNTKEKMTPPSLLKQVTSKLKSFIPFWKN